MSAGTLEAAAEMVRALALPRPGEQWKRTLARTAAALGISERLAKSLVYRDWSSVSPDTARALLENKGGALRADLERSRAEMLALARHIEAVERQLVALGDGGWGEGGAAIPGRGGASGAGGASPSCCSGGSAFGPSASPSGRTTRRAASRADGRYPPGAW